MKTTTIKLLAEDITEMRVAASAAVGLFPRIQVDPEHVIELCALANEALRLRPIVAEVADGITVSEHYGESARHTCSDCGAEDQRSPRVMHSAECIVSRARSVGAAMTATRTRCTLNGGATWAECLCAEIDPADVPCNVCEARASLGLPPCDALVFEYCNEWWEFAGYVEPTGNEKWDEQTYGYCLYGFPIGKPFTRPDLPGFIFNRREIMPLTPAMENV